MVDQLLTERQGIMRWAVTGYQMLLQRRRFSEPTRSQDLREHWEELAAPVKSFVQECLVRDPNGTISKGAMFEHYQQWCVDRTLTPPTAEQFAKDLRAAVPEIRTIQRRENGRARHWAGLEFRQPAGVDIMRLAGQAVA